MTSINPIANLPATPGEQSSSSASLGKDDFLKLLVGQVQHQDPMNPSSNQDFVGQMAQFSMVEQLSNVAKSNETMLATIKGGQAVSLLGKTVTYRADDGSTTEGVVKKVSTVPGAPTLTVGDHDGVDPSAVTEVK